MRSLQIFFKDSDPKKTTELLNKIVEQIQASGLTVEKSSHAGNTVGGLSRKVAKNAIHENITNGQYSDTDSTVYVS